MFSQTEPEIQGAVETHHYQATLPAQEQRAGSFQLQFCSSCVVNANVHRSSRLVLFGYVRQHPTCCNCQPPTMDRSAEKCTSSALQSFSEYPFDADETFKVEFSSSLAFFLHAYTSKARFGECGCRIARQIPGGNGSHRPESSRILFQSVNAVNFPWKIT